jgi:hypothetical protein
MRPLHRLWQAIESLPGLSASGAEWKQRLGDDFESLKRFLLLTDRIADCIPDAQDSYSHRRVVRHSDDDIVGINDRDASIVPLGKTDVLIYRLNTAKLSEAAIIAFGWEPMKIQPTSLTPIRAGTIRPLDLPAFLAIPRKSKDLLDFLQSLDSNDQRGMVLLTPSSRFVQSLVEDWLSKRNGHLFPLTECLELGKGERLLLTEQGKQRVLAFQRVLEQQQKQPRRASFTANRSKRGKQQVVPVKSWTQVDLDEEIRKYKAERASSYPDLVAGVRANRQAAKSAAQEIYGRNSIVRALGVKSRAMVTKSLVWQAIADELGISRGKERNRKSLQKIGFDIATEKQAEEASASALETAVQNETIKLLRDAMGREEAELIVERLRDGTITDDQARELAETVKDQKRDSRTRKVSGRA